RALIGGSVDGSGSIVQGSPGEAAQVGTTAGFDNVTVAADSERTLRVATGAAGIGLSVGGIGIAVTVAQISGDTDARIGDYAAIGATGHRVGNVSVTATGAATLIPFQDDGPMGIAIAGGLLLGAAAGGIGAGGGTSATAHVTPTVQSTLEADVQVTTTGDVKVQADSLRAKAAVKGFGLTLSAGSVGVIGSDGQVSPTVTAYVGDNA